MKRTALTLLLAGLCTGPALAVQYAYDNLNRLTRVIYDNGARIDYGYDAAGNLLTVVKSVGTASTWQLSRTVSTGGTVQALPGGYNRVTSGAKTTEDFLAGTPVTLSAVKDNGYEFVGWTGDCAGAATTCQLTMDRARDVFATFSALGGAPLSGVGTVTVSGSAPGPGGAPGAGGTVTARVSGGGSGQWVFTRAEFLPVPPGGMPPPGVQFLYGLFDFELALGEPGSTATVVLTYPRPLPPNTVYWKYGRTQADPTPHWYTLPPTQAVLSPDRRSITLTLTDGGLADDDLQANGVIVDPSGAGYTAENDASAIPALGSWLLAVLSGLLGLAGGCAVAMRRRR